MRLRAPRTITFLISLILVALGIIAQLGAVDALDGYGIWLVLAGYVILALGTMLKGL